MLERKATRLALGLLLGCLVLRFDWLAHDTKAQTNDELDAITQSLRDPSWEPRADAFYKLLGYESTAKWDGRTYLIPQELASVFRASGPRGRIKVGFDRALKQGRYAYRSAK